MKLITKSADLGASAEWRENAGRLRKLNKRFKLFWNDDDTWLGVGFQGKIWEYGVGKLGFTVETSHMINKAIKEGFVLTQRGDDEANFSCPWNDENIAKLTKLLKLRTRRSSDVPSNLIRNPAHSTEIGSNSDFDSKVGVG